MANSIVIENTRYMNLDLNGHTLTTLTNDYVIKNNGNLVIVDSKYPTISQNTGSIISTAYSTILNSKDAILNGADEIDMVINLGDVKDKHFDKIKGEIALLKSACGDKILKVIIETCLLTEEEKIKMCEIVTEAGADFIKTSTGFSTSGATFDDIALFKKYVGENVKIKAAGGISSFDDAKKFIELGADRLGTSRLVKIAKAEA